MKKILSFFLILMSLNVFAQKSHEELIQDFLEQRKKMMEQMMKAFDDDEFFSDDFGGTDIFDQLKKNGLQGMNGFHSQGRNVEITEKMQDDGSIDVLITPQNDNVKLDIKTTDTSITVKSEIMEKIENEKEGTTSKSYSRSSFNQTINIPNGFTVGTPTQVNKSIKITLTPSGSGKKLLKTIDNKTPVGKRAGEDTI